MRTPFCTDIRVEKDSAIFSKHSPRLSSCEHLSGKGGSLCTQSFVEHYVGGCYGPDLEVERTKSRGPCNLQGQLSSLVVCAGGRRKEHSMTSLQPLPSLVLEDFYFRKRHSPGKLL